MKQLITITDLTRMAEQRVCIAGYTPDNMCIRPVLSHNWFHEDWLRDGEQVVVRPFATIEVLLQKNEPKPPHCEDWLIDPNYRIQREVLLPAARNVFLSQLIDENIEAIFAATVHKNPGWYVMAGEGKRSLGTISPKVIAKVLFFEQRGTYQILFKDQAENWYRLTVNDLNFRAYARHLLLNMNLPPHEVAQKLTTALKRRRVFLRIGLSRGWREHPDKCFLQITGVHTFPDYLEGRCFADFDHA